MNNIIYKWLLDNNNSNETESIIESIVILSINGILIEYNSLLNYCSSNKNNDTPSYSGLNNNQFQLLNNNIQSTLLSNNIDNDNNTTTIHYNNIKNKFDCLIAIISDNNTRNLNNKLQPQPQQQRKNIVTDTIRSNDNGSSKSHDIDHLFFKAWRNIIIKREILYHLRFYNIHLNKQFKIGPVQLLKYKYKSYINNLELIENCDKDEFQRTYDGLTYPTSLQHFTFSFHSGDIFKFSCLQGLHSLTSITLLGKFNQSLNGGWLSGANIKSLEFGHKFQHSIKIGQLPESLTSLKLHYNYNGIIEYGSIPKSVTTLDYLYDGSDKIPKSTTNLKFDNRFNEIIKKGDIPHNVTTLEFGKSFNNEIKINSLPPSITTLKFGSSYNQEIKKGKLPSNLTSLVFGDFYNKALVSPSTIPLSITYIEFNCDYIHTIKEGTFSNHTNLKSLVFKENVVEISPNSLPSSLTHLGVRHYENEIIDLNDLKKVFPSSLKSLSFISNKDIRVGDLPDQLTSYSIEFYKNYDGGNIEIGSFSSSLKSLSFSSQDHKLDLTTEGLLPQTLESLYINCNNIDVLNSFDSNYFHDKIKLLNNNKK